MKNTSNPHTIKKTLQKICVSYRTTTWWWKLLSAVLITFIITSVAFNQNANFTETITLTVIILTCSHVGLTYPSFTATCSTIAAGSVISVPISYVYATAATNGTAPTTTTPVLTTISILCLTGLLAHRLQNRRPWLTVLTVIGGIIFIGPFLLILVPGLGFGWAWITTTIIIILHSGGIRWTTRKIRQIRDDIRIHRYPDPPPKTFTKISTTQTKDEQKTSAILTNLPDNYTVLNNYQFNNGFIVSHLIIGPTGTWYLNTHHIPNQINVENNQLTHNTINIQQLIYETIEDSSWFTKKILPKKTKAYPMIAITPARLPQDIITVEITTKDTTEHKAIITNPQKCVTIIMQAPKVYSLRKQQRVTQKIIQKQNS